MELYEMTSQYNYNISHLQLFLYFKKFSHVQRQKNSSLLTDGGYGSQVGNSGKAGNKDNQLPQLPTLQEYDKGGNLGNIDDQLPPLPQLPT